MKVKVNPNYKDLFTGGNDRSFDPRKFLTKKNLKYLDKFKPKDNDPIIKLTDIPGTLEYTTDKEKEPKASLDMAFKIHIGQRKLFLTELQHCIKHMNSYDEEILIIYAGAAPSNKIFLHSVMFPNARYILVDPNEFNIYVAGFHESHFYHEGHGIVYMSTNNNEIYKYYTKDKYVTHYKQGKINLNRADPISYDDEAVYYLINDKENRIYIFNEYFTKEIGILLNKVVRAQKKVLFWSDIRSNTNMDNIGKFYNFPLDVDILGNAAMTYVWCKELVRDYEGEFYSMLKFKLLYYNQVMDEEYKLKMENSEYKQQFREAREMGYDPIKDHKDNKEFYFFDGDIYIQAFKGRRATETRLHSTKEQILSPLVKYDLKEYDDRIFFYNMVARFGVLYKNPFSSRKLGFDHCNDCAIEAHIRGEYYKKFYPNKKFDKVKQVILLEVAQMSEYTSRPLTCYPHGKAFPPEIRGGLVDPNKIINPNNFISSMLEKYKSNETISARILRSDIPDQIPYINKFKTNKLHSDMAKVCHNGQLKLFLTEIQHITSKIDSLDEEFLIIYVGAAPSNKAAIYMEEFKNSKMIMIDPNEFLIYFDEDRTSHYSEKYRNKVIYYSTLAKGMHTTDKYPIEDKKIINHYKDGEIEIQEEESNHGWDEDMIDFLLNNDYKYNIFQEYMTTDFARVLNKLIKKWNKKVLFWSDVRTNFSLEHKKRTSESPSDTDIVANTAMTYSWLKILTDLPDSFEFYSMLKFRLPYLFKPINWDAIEKHIDEASYLGADYKDIMKENNGIKWFKGEIYLQAYAGYQSAESRLWSDLSDLKQDLILYPLKEHEEKLFYYNMVERFGRYFENKYSIRNIGFDHCGDCAIMATIWNDYYDKFYRFNKKEKCEAIEKQIILLGKMTCRNLLRNPHGYNFK